MLMIALTQNFEFVLGAFAIVTGLVLGFVPLKLSYRPVALAAPWDLIMFLMYSAAFGYMKDIRDKLDGGKEQFVTSDTDNGKYIDHIQNMRHKMWINLVGMVLFIISAIMGAVLLWVGRKNSRAARHSAV